MKNSRASLSCCRTIAMMVLAAAFLGTGSLVVGQRATARPLAKRADPTGLNERDLIVDLIKLRQGNSGDRIRQFLSIIRYADELIRRYPRSEYHDEAKIAKMDATLGLGPLQPAYLDALQELIQTIECGEASQKLTSEAAYFEIQAFAVRANADRLSVPSRRMGTGILQKQFLDEHADSPRVPAVAAGYIHNLVARGEMEEARRQLDKWKKVHPNNGAFLRAEGRWFRAQAVGQPFAIEVTTPDDRTVRTIGELGKVVVVHLWSGWTEKDREHLPSLVQLHNELSPEGLRIIGVNLDRDRARAESAITELRMDWPQYFDKRGFNSDVCVRHDIRSVPTMFVIDRTGVLRSIDSGDNVREEVLRWMSSP